MPRARRIALLAALLAMVAVGGRAVAASWHHHADGDRDHPSGCAVCHAVHTAGTAPEPPETLAAPAPGALPVTAGCSLPAVLFGLTASNTRGPPALLS